MHVARTVDASGVFGAFAVCTPGVRARAAAHAYTGAWPAARTYGVARPWRAARGAGTLFRTRAGHARIRPRAGIGQQGEALMLRGFPPVVAADTHTLILGSFPGEA